MGLQATDVPADPPWAWRCRFVSVLEPAGKSVLERDGGFRPDTDHRATPTILDAVVLLGLRHRSDSF